MKASLTGMISSMVMDVEENPQQTIDEIFSNKYRKFVSLYWLIKEYSNCIKKLSYRISKKDTLKIKIQVANMQLNELVERLQEKAEERALDVDIQVVDSKLIIVINYDESELP